MRYALAIIVGILLSVMADKAIGQEFNVGDQVTVIGFCLGEEATRKLSMNVALTGMHGYNRVMRDPNTECYDVRITDLGAKSFDLELVEKKWQLRTPDQGLLYQFWRAKDLSTENSFIWIRMPGKST